MILNSRTNGVALCGISAVIALLATNPALAAVGSWSSSGPYGGSTSKLLVYEAGPSTVFAAGRSGIFRSLNNGTSWERIRVGLPETTFVQSLAISTTTPTLYLSTSFRLFRSGNAGDLWVPLASPLAPNAYINDLSVRRGTSNSLAIATSNGIQISNNGGASWSGPGTTAGAEYSKVLFAQDGSLYAGIRMPDPAVFGGASLIKSTDGGTTWTSLAPPAGFEWNVEMMAASPVDAQRLYISSFASLATSSDGGTSWVIATAPNIGFGCGGISSLVPHPTTAQAVFVGCEYSGVHYSANIAVDGWTSWTPANGLSVDGTSPVTPSAIAVHPGYPATPTLWVGAVDGGLFRSTNAGTSWTSINDGYRGMNIRALATHPIDTNPAGAVVLAGYGDAVSASKTILKSSNGASTWNVSTNGLKAKQVRSLAIDPTTVDSNPFTAENFTVYAAGRSERYPDPAGKDGGLYKSTDAGDTWTTIDNGIATYLGARDMGTVRAIALDPRSCAAPPVSGPCPVGGGSLQTLYVAGSGRPNLSSPGLPFHSARIYKSINAGASWVASDIGIPTSQQLGTAPDTYLAYTGGIVPLVIDPQNTQTLYAGSFISFSGIGNPGEAAPTLANGVFKSVDGGASWVLSSNGLPRYADAGSSHRDVLALAINPTNPSVLYAGVVDLYSTPVMGRIYKTTDAGANWFESSAGIAGQDVRALFIDPADPTGDTIYAGTGGDGANQGGVYRSTNGGASWNSLSLGLPAYAATALAIPPRASGAPVRILAGTDSGVWDYTTTPDEDADGVPSAMENSVMAGDGNGDGIPDSTQAGVASFNAAPSVMGIRSESTQGTNISTTVSLIPTPGGCSQLNDISSLQSALYPPDPAGAVDSHDPWGLVSLSIPACTSAKVLVKFHGANFNANWTWRNYGPRIPGDQNSFGWYSFAGARRIDAQTWELTIDARRQGNYRNDEDNILFIGGPANLPELIFDHGFE